MEVGIQGAGDSSEKISEQLWLFSVSEEAFLRFITLQCSLLRHSDALAHPLFECLQNGAVRSLAIRFGGSGSCVSSVQSYPQPVRSQNYPFWKGISEE